MAGRYDPEKERLKREVSIQRLAEARGIKLHRSGKELIGLCPFHDDRNPSLNIDPVKNVWHCKGACGEGGDVIRWVARSEGVSYRARHRAAEKRLCALFRAGGENSHDPQAALPGDAGSRRPDGDARGGQVLRRHAAGHAGRKALSRKAGPQIFGAGRAVQAGVQRPDAGPCPAGQEPRARVRRYADNWSGWASSARAATSICAVPSWFRCSNLEGDVVQLYGRKINDNLRGGTDYHLYLPGPMRGVWNEEALVASKEIILCEALIDAMTFWCAGYRQVTASYGVNGFTKDHRAAFERHGIERVYIAYDGDEAGNKAAVKLADELMQHGRRVLPRGVPQRHGRERVRAQDAARNQAVRPSVEPRGVDGQGRAASGPRGRSGDRSRTIAAPPTVAAPAAEEPAAKEKMIEEQAPEPEPIIEPQPAETKQQLKKKSSRSPCQGRSQVPAPVPVASEPAQEPQHSRGFSLSCRSCAARADAAQDEQCIDAPVEMRGEDIVQRHGDREYRVRGLQKNMSPDALQVNLRVLGVNAHGDMALHVDKLDLEARAAARGVHQAGGGRAGRQGRRDPPRRGPVDPEAGRAAATSRSPGARAARAGGHDDR